MVFVYLIGFFLFSYMFSNILNITVLFTTVININYSSIIVLVWVGLIVCQLFLTQASTSWVTDLVLYTFGVYRTILSNFISSVFVFFKNMNVFFVFIKYNLNGVLNFFTNQIWTPLYRRGGYLLLLNSSRTRWQLSKSNSIFKNK